MPYDRRVQQDRMRGIVQVRRGLADLNHQILKRLMLSASQPTAMGIPSPV
jgi:hypothetical protein